MTIAGDAVCTRSRMRKAARYISPGLPVNLYDLENGGCREYARRSLFVPECIVLSAENIAEIGQSCQRPVLTGCCMKGNRCQCGIRCISGMQDFCAESRDVNPVLCDCGNMRLIWIILRDLFWTVICKKLRKEMKIACVILMRLIYMGIR